MHQVLQRNPEAHSHHAVAKHALENHQFLQDWWAPSGDVSSSTQNLQKEFSNLQQQVEKLNALQLNSSQANGKGSQTTQSGDKPKKRLSDEEWEKKHGWMKDHSKEEHTDSSGTKWILCKKCTRNKKGAKGKWWKSTHDKAHKTSQHGKRHR